MKDTPQRARERAKAYYESHKNDPEFQAKKKARYLKAQKLKRLNRVDNLCSKCGAKYRLNHHRSKICPSCRLTCPICGGKRTQGSKICLECYLKTKETKYGPGKCSGSGGYVYVSIAEHPKRNKSTGKVTEHTLVMEESIGRYLFGDENIHHKNGIRDDNRLNNLELWIKPQPKGIRASDAVIWAKEILSRYPNMI